MTKDELVLRLGEVANRLGLPFTGYVLDGWIEDDLIGKGQRFGNNGRKPIYAFGDDHFQRGVQILHLIATGFSDHDAIGVRLFIDGAIVRPAAFKSWLERECKRSLKAVNSPVRSTYATNHAELSPARQVSLASQLGELDRQFRDAGLALPIETVVEAYRTGRRVSVNGNSAPEVSVNIKEVNLIAFIQAARPVLLQRFGGLLRPFGNFTGNTENPIECAIRMASSDDMRRARDLLKLVRYALQKFGVIANLFTIEMTERNALTLAGDAAAASILAEEWCASAFAACVYLAKSDLPEIDSAKLERLVKIVERRPDKFRSKILKMISSADSDIKFPGIHVTLG